MMQESSHPEVRGRCIYIYIFLFFFLSLTSFFILSLSLFLSLSLSVSLPLFFCVSIYLSPFISDTVFPLPLTPSHSLSLSLSLSLTSPTERLLASIKFNLKFYLIVCILLIIFIIYLTIRSDFSSSQMLGFLMVLGNTWGLFLSVLLLGYGLVEIPRRFWFKGDRKRRLEELFFMASGTYTELENAKERVLDAIDTVREIERNIPTSDPLRYYFDKVVMKTPLSDSIEDHSRIGDFEQSPVLADLRIQEPSKANLSLLNYHVKSSVRNLEQCRMAWRELLEKIEKLEYEVAQETSPAPLGPPIQILKWKYKIHWKGPLYRVIGVFFAVLSVLTVWSEMTMFAEKDLSPFGLLIHAVE